MDILQNILMALSDTGPIAQILAFVPSVIGIASLLVKAFSIFAKITPSKKDDVLAGTLEKWLTKIVAFFDRIALNPDSSAARKR